MEDLPPPLLLDILNRLSDSADVARCRLVSRTLRSLSYQVSSVNVLCSRDRFLRSRAPETRDRTLPFKSLVANLVSLHSAALDSLSIGVERPSAAGAAWEEDDFDDADDLHLTAVGFLSRWLPLVGGRLRSLSISDFWIQSCWRRSGALGLISDLCYNLVNLEVRNAWLSVEGLKPMQKLTTLTMEFIRLDDEDLEKVNKCFPSLEVLNLIGVGGLKEPKICLSKLRICCWTVSNFPLSLTIQAPNLVELQLKCVEPKVLHLCAPSLTNFSLILKRPSGLIKVERFLNLRSLSIESLDIRSLAEVLLSSKTVKKLELEAPRCTKADESSNTISFIDLMSAFPNMDELNLGPGVWYELQKTCGLGDLRISCELGSLKKLTVRLPLLECDTALLFFILNHCSPCCEVAILIHADAESATRECISSKCTSNFPKIRWKWGMWKESFKDTYLDL
ncbi:F-box/LRR-repeat protein At4g29420 [Phoenix dactylifera]|uniref:F-box/LRR-repeat protein At4g29420 n=1 Tax=Phoenix dactylifera TaxID=42345 RepID=A0A8B7BP13_PHODC|nr:F-box/LRR-repeat protein At4g29420 [Phoenix dactylifera]